MVKAKFHFYIMIYNIVSEENILMKTNNLKVTVKPTLKGTVFKGQSHFSH